MRPTRLSFALLLAALCVAPAASAQDLFRGAAREAARADVEEMKQVQAQWEQDLLNRRGVIAVGISVDRLTERLVFKVTVDERARMPVLPKKLGRFDVLVDRDTPQRPLNGGSACMPCHANQLSLPVQMGNSGRTNATGQGCGSCTMGFKACEEQTGDAVWVTSSHCASDGSTCPGSAPVGSPAVHVSPGDAACNVATTSNVGSLSASAAPGGAGGTTVDATAIDSDASLTSTSIRDIGAPSAVPGNALPGDEVQKSGRTTGYTIGVVDSINASVNVTFNCGTIAMTQQIRIDDATGDIFCAGGDSGSGVLDFEQPPNVVGLIMSGNAAGTRCHANDINNVLAALNLSMNHTECFEDSCPASDIFAATEQPESNLDRVRRLRDEVLGSTEMGKEWIRTFYAVSPAWVALYVRNPGLFDATRQAANRNADVLRAVADGEQIQIPRRRLNRVLRLIDRHVEAAQDPDLRLAFRMWREDLADAKVQNQFGVRLR